MLNKRMLIGEILQQQGLIGSREVDFCLHEQMITGEKFGELLQRSGFVTQYDVADAMANQLGLEFVDLTDVIPSDRALKAFTLTMCRKHDMLPITIDDDRVVVATANRDIDTVRSMVESRTGKKAAVQFAESGKLHQMLYHFYFFLENPVERLIQNEITNVIADREGVRTLDSLLHNVIRLAVKLRATDIHVRPMERVINIAFRIDGVMHSMFSLGQEFTRLISTIKLAAGMDIADSRLPQDGAFEIKLNEDAYDVRASTVIVPAGENIVLRLLQRNHEVLRLSQLGFLDEHIALLNRVFNKPSGIVLLTGPTGSGKSTTLHAGLRSINILEKNILTVEDPIEYRLPLVRQTEVNEKSGYTFSSAIRHFLRHDPDVILVGEIRDRETAEIAMTAAETGHLVLSTLHTNNALGVVPRLRSLGIENHMIADALVCAVSQRLIRKICPECTEEYEATQDECDFLNIEPGTTLKRGTGCSSCSDTGYRGREPIYEIVVVSPAFVEGVETGVAVSRLETLARTGEYVSMYDVGRAKVIAGVTTAEEVRHFATPLQSK